MAVVICLAVSWLLTRGTRASARVETVLTIVWIAIVLVVVVVGFTKVDFANLHPFAPFGVTGALTGASTVFFAVFGFDALSTAAEESVDAQRKLPKAMMLTLAVSMALHVLATIVLTGIPYSEINPNSGFASAFASVGLSDGRLAGERPDRLRRLRVPQRPQDHAGRLSGVGRRGNAMKTIPQWQLRAAFAQRLSDMYGREVPAYTALVEVSHEVNDHVLRKLGADAERFGTISRVTAERHGAIRLGTPRELREVGHIFGALGMHPVGFYDLRAAASSSVPVVSTAFRPIDAGELARNPFRMFTSVLTTDDARFFGADLRARLEAFLADRQLFSPELLELAEVAERARELPEADAERFLELAVSSFELSSEPIDRAWYEELEKFSAVAADIGGVRSTHVNHLTPRVLDIDELYRRMSDRGIEMIDSIQGPPHWGGPDVLLRQTSFRALSEPRMMRHPDGSVAPGSLRVRFGEVEARGIALTPAGRSRYDAMLEDIDRRAADGPANRAGLAREAWEAGFPATERDLLELGLAYFEFRRFSTAPLPRSGRLVDLLDQGLIAAEPITYEDFLPRSAGGIFQSNLNDEGNRDDGKDAAAHYDAKWLSDTLEHHVHDPYALYEQQQERSIKGLTWQVSSPTLEQ